jgi:hypothetical protein
MNYLVDVLTSLVVPSVLIGAVAWVAKAIVTHKLSGDIERTRSRLQHDVEAYKADLQQDVEAFKANLTIEANRDNTVFSRLHERRAEVIAELYAALVAAEAAVRHYLSEMGAPTPPAGQTLAGVALTAMWHLQVTAESKQIWFTPDTAAKVDSVVTALRQAWNLGAFGKRYEEPNESTLKMVETAWNTVYEKVPALRAALEAEFRDLLSVELRPKRV